MGDCYRGRFAPSPTGPLHMGSLSTALYSYIDARQHHGRWLLRFDDLDTRRCRPVHTEAILRTLEGHGLYWDESIYFQSQQSHGRYEDVLTLLKEKGSVYRCQCSRSSLARQGEHVRYSGRCAGKQESIREDSPFSWRVTVAESNTRDFEVGFVDRLQNQQRSELINDSGDFVVWRRENIPAYPLSTVIDDATMGITHIVRGIDLLSHTPKQIYLQQMLGYPEKSYAHLPVVVDAQGIKLSKQNLARPVDDLPSANLMNLLAMGGFEPPADLHEATIRQILDWACHHVRLERFSMTQSLTMHD